MIQRGWALAEQGQREAGSTQIRQGVAAFRATGANTGLPHHLAILVETCVQGKQIDEGLSILAEALAIANSGGVRWYEAELYRLKGEALLTLSAEQYTAAEACFRQALDIARRQEAKLLELRAAMSLSRLWQHHGKRQEAHDLLRSQVSPPDRTERLNPPTR
jgi:predicted ATPase